MKPGVEKQQQIETNICPEYLGLTAFRANYILHKDMWGWHSFWRIRKQIYLTQKHKMHYSFPEFQYGTVVLVPHLIPNCTILAEMYI